MFKVEARSGEVTLSEHPRLVEAIDAAMVALDDDPELGAVEVYGALGDRTIYVGQATTVPNEQWLSVTRWVWANAKITPPAHTPGLMTDREFEEYVSDAYADDFTKAEGLRRMREDGWL